MKKEVIWNNIFNQILELGGVLLDLMRDAKGYDEVKMRAYEILALDIMITDDYKIKLLEVNSKVGYGFEPEEKALKFNDYFLSSQLEITIDDIFEPKNNINKTDGYVEVFGRRKGGYHRKYIKYKTKYLELKKKMIL